MSDVSVLDHNFISRSHCTLGCKHGALCKLLRGFGFQQGSSSEKGVLVLVLAWFTPVGGVRVLRMKANSRTSSSLSSLGNNDSVQ